MAFNINVRLYFALMHTAIIMRWILFTTSDLCSRCRRRELGTGVLVVSWHFLGGQFFLVLADIAGQYHVYPLVTSIIKFAHYIWEIKLVMIYIYFHC